MNKNKLPNAFQVPMMHRLLTCLHHMNHYHKCLKLFSLQPMCSGTKFLITIRGINAALQRKTSLVHGSKISECLKSVPLALRTARAFPFVCEVCAPSVQVSPSPLFLPSPLHVPIKSGAILGLTAVSDRIREALQNLV
jgi:hypothetical protein